MEAIPDIFGVEDSDELDESLQEDAQVGVGYHGKIGAGKWYWKDGSENPTVPPVEVGSWNPVGYRVLDIPGGAGVLSSTVPLNQMIAMDWWWSCLTCGTFEAWMSKDDRVIVCDYWLSSHFSRWWVWLHCFHSSQADIVEKICSTNNTEERDVRTSTDRVKWLNWCVSTWRQPQGWFILLMEEILHQFFPLFTGFYTSQVVVRDFFHQQYLASIAQGNNFKWHWYGTIVYYTPVNSHSNGKWTLWRCISYWTWWCSIAMSIGSMWYIYIYLHLPWKSTIHVGKYTSPMDPMDIYPSDETSPAPDRSRTCGKRCWPGWHNAQMQQGGHDCWLYEWWA